MTLDLSTYRAIEDSVPQFLKSLKLGEQAGRYLLCKRGATQLGREMGLGWSCFVLKTLHMLGRWDLLEREEREYWVEFIQDYQRTDGDGFFEDPPEIAYLRKPPAISARLLGLIGKAPYRPDPQIFLANPKLPAALRKSAERRAGRFADSRKSPSACSSGWNRKTGRARGERAGRARGWLSL